VPSKLEADIRKFRWEASKRAQLSGLIKTPQLERALELHIAGRYEDTIAEIERIPHPDRSAEAWRILGHAEHGLGNFEAALAAHRKARDLHARDASASADDASADDASADDEVNLAAVLISMKNYDAAWEATERALRLSPKNVMPWTPRIAILNHQERHDELRQLLRGLLAEKPEVLESPVLLNHLENDTDFIGVDEMIETLKS